MPCNLDSTMSFRQQKLKDWTTLHTQIKTHMKKHSKSMPLSQVNQYMILSSFATLCIRGIARIKASQEISQQWHDGDGTTFTQQV